ncbi:MAG: HD domain-containing protein [bacterium]
MINTENLIREIETLASNVAIHPAWGIAHCGRVEELAKEIARKEGKDIDVACLRVAALLHDFGAYPKYRKEGIDHAERSVEVAEEELQKRAFAEDKVRLVKTIIAGHMFYSEPDKTILEAVVFHDADILDFLGMIGIARVYSIIGIDDWAKNMTEAYDLLWKFKNELPAKIITQTAKNLADERVSEMDTFFTKLDSETFGKKYL